MCLPMFILCNALTVETAHGSGIAGIAFRFCRRFQATYFFRRFPSSTFSIWHAEAGQCLLASTAACFTALRFSGESFSRRKIFTALSSHVDNDVSLGLSPSVFALGPARTSVAAAS